MSVSHAFNPYGAEHTQHEETEKKKKKNFFIYIYIYIYKYIYIYIYKKCLQMSLFTTYI